MLQKILFSIFFYTFLYAHEKRLIVIIPSYNNEKWCDKNIKSVLMQKYLNYKVIYIDDCSNDSTYEKVKTCVNEFDIEDCFILHKNRIRQGKAKNIWLTIHNLLGIDFIIKDDDVIVILDGDDWYSNDYAFSYINEVFIKKNIWLTYGGCMDYPAYSENWSLDIPKFIVDKNEFRNFSRNTSQQRCFYSWLFKEISLSEFIYKGKVVTSSSDICKMYPMFEMAGDKFERFKNIIYVYNRMNECQNDDKLNASLQYNIDHHMRKREKYVKLDGPIFSNNKDLKVAFCIVQPNSNEKELQLFVQKIQKKLIGNVDVYLFLKEKILKIKKIDCKVRYFNNLKKELLQLLDENLYTHVLLTHDLVIPQKNINVEFMASYLYKTKAFYFDGLAEKNFFDVYDQLDEKVGIAQFSENTKCFNEIDLTIKMYDIEKLKFLFSNFEFSDFLMLQKKWKNIVNMIDKNSISLFTL